MNETLLVGPLFDEMLDKNLEVEFLAGESGFEARRVFDVIEAKKVAPLIAWRRMKGRNNSPEGLSVRDRIDVDSLEWMRVVYLRLRAAMEGFIGQVKSRLSYGRLMWQALENACIYVSLVLCVVYAVAIAASIIDRPELRLSVLLRLNDGLGWWEVIS